MNETEQGQVSASAAQVYDDFFVPALFQGWVSRVVDAAKIASGHCVLDVACGTGVVTREIAKGLGANGSVIGLDLNPGMLAVAKEKAPNIEWQQGNAEALPFDSNSFDVVICQFGLMFFEHRQAALKEMLRVLRQGGRLVIAVWDSLEQISLDAVS